MGRSAASASGERHGMTRDRRILLECTLHVSRVCLELRVHRRLLHGATVALQIFNFCHNFDALIGTGGTRKYERKYGATSRRCTSPSSSGLRCTVHALTLLKPTSCNGPLCRKQEKHFHKTEQQNMTESRASSSSLQNLIHSIQQRTQTLANHEVIVCFGP